MDNGQWTMDNYENLKTKVTPLFARLSLFSICRKTFADLLIAERKIQHPKSPIPNQSNVVPGWVEKTFRPRCRSLLPAIRGISREESEPVFAGR